MKILGELRSKRGHNEKDYLVKISLNEIKLLRKFVKTYKVKEKGSKEDCTRRSMESVLDRELKLK